VVGKYCQLMTILHLFVSVLANLSTTCSRRGFTYLYLLKNAVPLLPNGGSELYTGTGDDEQQTIMHLSVNEVSEYLSQARFQEVKWTATFALSLLHINNDMPSCCGEQE